MKINYVAPRLDNILKLVENIDDELYEKIKEEVEIVRSITTSLRTLAEQKTEEVQQLEKEIQEYEEGLEEFTKNVEGLKESVEGLTRSITDAGIFTIDYPNPTT